MNKGQMTENVELRDLAGYMFPVTIDGEFYGSVSEFEDAFAPDFDITIWQDIAAGTVEEIEAMNRQAFPELEDQAELAEATLAVAKFRAAGN